MRRHLSAVIALSMLGLTAPAASAVAAPGPTDLVISEYIEGSSNNKALELYNGTGSAIDLSTYTLVRYNNGATTPNETTPLVGTIEPGEVFVFANTSADASILSVADQTGAAFWNGDDALVLQNGTTVVDSLGRVGEDPGSEWGTGDASTQDNTIRRRDLMPDTETGDPFDPADRWVGYPIDDVSDLGIYTAIPADDAPLINEIRIDQEGGDDDEYVELAGTPGSSLDGLTYLVIGDGTGGSGVIESVTALSGLIADDGRFVVAEDTFTLGTAEQTATLDFENSDNVTHLLVSGFTGSDGDDLDPDDDGDLDARPWSLVVDTVSLVETVGSGDAYYATAAVGPAGTFVPAHVFRCDGWRIGEYAPLGATDTPGEPNCVDDGTQPRGRLIADRGEAVSVGECGDPATLISEVQGSGVESPLEGTEVEVEAVVTGIFPDLDAFTLQEEAADEDSSALTSEGILIYAPDVTDVTIGATVRVKGNVKEFSDKTEIALLAYAICDIPLVTIEPTTLDLPLPVADRERYEGMLLSVSDELSVTNLFPAGRYGQIGLSVGGVLRTATDVAQPGAAANAVEASNEARYLLIDDANGAQNPFPNPWFKDETSADPTAVSDDTDDPVLRVGDTVASLTGVLDQYWDDYMVLPTEEVTFTSVNPRTEAPDAVGGNAKIASFNVLNYFSTIDDSGSICGPNEDQGCRGADNETELADQQSKIVAAITALDADVVGLIEIENHPTDDALAHLVDALNAEAGAGTYDYVATGPVGSDAIRVALIFQPARAKLVGNYAVLDSSVDPDFNDDKNRAVLAQSFRIGGETLTVAVNHLKSKGSDCDDLGDPDTGDGQANCNVTRTEGAQAEVEWLATNPTSVNDADILVIGDLNAYTNEDPVEVFTDAGYVDIVERELADGDDHTYSFDGRLGRLDHALASTSLAAKITGADVWHINSEEVYVLGYDTQFEPHIAPGPYFSSDHDPVLVGLQVPAAPAPAPAPAPGPKDDDVTTDDEGVTVTDLESSPAGTKPLSTVEIEGAGTYTLTSSEARPSGPRGQMLFALLDGAPLPSCATADEPCVVSAAGAELVIRTSGPVTLDIVSLTRACPTALTESGLTGMAAAHRDSVSCADWWSLVEGYEDGTFGGGDALKRMQAATILKELLLEAGVELADNPEDRTPDYDGVHDRALNQLIDLGVMSGYADGTSGARDVIERGQFATMLDATLAVALGDTYPTSAPDAFADDEGDTHEAAIDRLASLGIFTGNADGEAASGDTIQRQHAAALLARALEVWFAA